MAGILVQSRTNMLHRWSPFLILHKQTGMRHVVSCPLRLRLWGIPKKLLEDVPLPRRSLQSWEKDEPITPRLVRGQSKGSYGGWGQGQGGKAGRPWASRGMAQFCFSCFVIFNKSLLTFKDQEISHMGQVCLVCLVKEKDLTVSAPIS